MNIAISSSNFSIIRDFSKSNERLEKLDLRVLKRRLQESYPDLTKEAVARRFSSGVRPVNLELITNTLIIHGTCNLGNYELTIKQFDVCELQRYSRSIYKLINCCTATLVCKSGISLSASINLCANDYALRLGSSVYLICDAPSICMFSYEKCKVSKVKGELVSISSGLLGMPKYTIVFINKEGVKCLLEAWFTFGDRRVLDARAGFIELYIGSVAKITSTSYTGTIVSMLPN